MLLLVFCMNLKCFNVTVSLPKHCMLQNCENAQICPSFLFCIYRNNMINLSPLHLPGVLGPCDSSPEWIPFFISIAFLSSIWLSPPLCPHTNQGSVWLKGVVVLFLTQWQQSKHFIVSKQRRDFFQEKILTSKTVTSVMGGK